MSVPSVVELVPYYIFREKIFYNTKQFNENYYIMPINTNAPTGKITYKARYFISSLSDEIEASLYFLYCLNYDKELYTLFRYGIEDTDYVNTPSGLELNNLYGHSQMSYKFENPFIEPKLAHDFSLWGEFMEGYLAAQDTNRKMMEQNRDEQIIRETVKNIRESDSYFDEVMKERTRSYNNIYELFKSDNDAIHEFMNGFKPDDGKYVIDQIMMNP
ncbi:MAG TPA: hypothetical protein DDZ89_03720 [Clostridiales bacterium]|nr:hypothetical protein [Clostridiales bacterium]